MWSRFGAPWLAVGLLGWAGTEAQANDGTSARTPVSFEDPPCSQRVDRSRDPVLHLPYAIPFEDTDVPAHEVKGSRTHQFFAFCRREHPRASLPNWITWADVDAAVQAKLILSSDRVDAQDVLEESDRWNACWVRVSGDDERRPITFEMADAGVDWDTTGLAAGAYSVAGYTFHPRLNLWSPRPGVVKVHDGDPDAAGPAAAITTTETLASVGDPVDIAGCVDAASGSTLNAFRAEVQVQGEPRWIRFVEDVVIDGDAFSIELVPSDELAGTALMVRVDVRDPSGRAYTTYMQDFVIVLEGTDPGPCHDTDGATDTACEPPAPSTSGDESSPPTGSTGPASRASTHTDGTTPQRSDEASSCGCVSAHPPTVGLFWIGLLALGLGRIRES